MDSILNQKESHPMPSRKVHIETWGCQMNVADSEKMLSLLEKENYSVVFAPEDADLILLNTCHIREKARHKVVSRLGVLQSLRASKPNLKIALAGCVAQAEGKTILDEAPQIDILFGPGKIDDLPELIRRHDKERVSVSSIGFTSQSHRHTENEGAVIPPNLSGKREVTRFINIIQGCNNFCTFCVVPFTRGREISREADEILNEAKAMVSEGVREITLLGQNVNSYGLDLINTDIVPEDGGPFVSLLSRVCQIEGLERLRFTTSNPHDFTRPLAELFRSTPKLGKYLHLPVQAGSNRTLERMKRKVTVEEYLQKIDWIRTAVPGIAISTDLIVGFPGETTEEFNETLELMRKVKFSFVYAFKYSSRKGTAASRFLDKISESEMDERLKKLNALQDEITNEIIRDEIGAVLDVLFIYQSNKSPGVYVGKTPQYRTVRVKSSTDLVGRTHKVQITHGNKVALVGEIANLS